MNKKIALSAICTFLVVPLFSCSGESTSPSSTSPSSSSSTGEPIYLHENYRRDGNLRMGVSFSYQESSETLGYESPIALMFQADEKKRYGDDASLQIYPFRLDGEEAEKLQQAERNREVLQLLFSLSNSLLEEQEADSGLLPILADRYATPFESLEELPDETFLMNSLDGRPVFFDTIEEEGKNRLTYFEEGEQTSNPLDGFDLDTIQLNAPALLAYLDELFPVSDLRRKRPRPRADRVTGQAREMDRISGLDQFLQDSRASRIVESELLCQLSDPTWARSLQSQFFQNQKCFVQYFYHSSIFIL